MSHDLGSRIAQLPAPDRRRFRRRLAGAERLEDESRRRHALGAIEAELDRLVEGRRRRADAVPSVIAYPDDLPITERRAELLDVIRENQVVIVAGETGSGKSTQLPKLCLELGRGVDGLIGHTQPRRIAARSIAERIAEELGSSVGDRVGYTVRFSDQVGDRTLIKVMTDGILLAEIQRDRLLETYDTLILDEAHERSLNIDFLLGYLKDLLPRRPDLKVIITSATIDTARFSEHFGDAPIVEVSGRTYPVEIRYRPLDDPARSEVRDQTQGICEAVVELFDHGPGDVLVFCSGEREIRDAAEALRELELPHTEVLPLYARLSAADQHRVFAPHTGNRVVVATNVAETSLTVPGIRYVVDAGTARVSRFSRRTKVQQLPIEPISQASANQRAGRCGRLGPGVCIRLYSEDDFANRPEFTDPEIQRTQLASVILQLATLRLGDIETFPFLDPPDRRTVRDGVALLEEIGAVDPAGAGSGDWVTDIGRQVARLPIDLRLGRMIVEAGKLGCVEEVLVIASGLAIQDPRERPVEERGRADQLHARFRDPDSDFMSWLNLWEYLRTERRARSSNAFRRMCREELLNHRRVREWQDVRAQLRQAVDELGLRRNRRDADPRSVHLALLAGLLSHVGVKDPKGYEYRGARGTRFAINPGSALFKRAPQWVMAAELVETTRLWARQVAPVDPADVERAAGDLVVRNHSDPWWDAARGASVARQTTTLYGLPLGDRVVQYGTVDPVAARDLFIRHALVAGEWETPHAFVEHNRTVLAEALALEDRFRRTDVLVDDETVVAWFSERLPDDIVTVRHFDRWWRDVEDRSILLLQVDDLIDEDAELVEEDFPDVVRQGDVSIQVHYRFDPASARDGITFDIPLDRLERVDPARLEWSVPGVRYELVDALLRGLPKRFRKQLAPIPDTIREMLSSGIPDGVGLRSFVRRAVARRVGEDPGAGAVEQIDLPVHLEPWFRVVSEDGSVVGEGTDVSALKASLRRQTRAEVAATSHPIEATGLSEWTFGTLPLEVEIGEDASGRAYPALVDEGGTVGIRLTASPAEQADAMWGGTRRMLAIRFGTAPGLLAASLTTEGRAALAVSPYPSAEAWAEDCLACALDDHLARHGGPRFDEAGYEALAVSAEQEMEEALVDVAETSLEIVLLNADLKPRIDGLPELLNAAAEDMRVQLDRLIYPGFVGLMGAARLPDVLRYLRAIERRLDSVAESSGRDAQYMTVVQTLEAEHDRLADRYGGTPEHVDVGWMLQELRVGLFAQMLGTRVKVSESRVRRALTVIDNL